MPPSIETFTEGLRGLISKFEADQFHYLSKSYSEAQARQDFITPFFKSLGWDMENEAGLAHPERECLVEKREATHRVWRAGAELGRVEREIEASDRGIDELKA